MGSRERRLWLVVAAVLASTWAVVPLVGWLSPRVPQDVVALAFVLAMAGTAVTASIQGWARVRGRELGVWAAIATMVALVFVRITEPTARSHLMEYAVVAVLVGEALTERARSGKPVPRPAWLAFGITALLGLADEGLQWLAPNRVFDWNDVVFNVVAAAFGAGWSGLLRWARQAPEDVS